ncbi:hypothetical protein, partial [Stenotrophomonas maltophilia]|uniref:hypothetical protein n=1 Tax=Stenotrophomonas maltophilia TaxID=40324 RepID=UPI0034E28787
MAKFGFWGGVFYLFFLLGVGCFFFFFLFFVFVAGCVFCVFCFFCFVVGGGVFGGRFVVFLYLGR